MDPYIENISEKYIFNDMNLVDRDLYDIDAKDYFLLDKEAIKAIVYRDNKLDLDIDEEDKVLVVLI